MLKTLLDRIESKHAVVGVVRLGYAGLPLVLLFEEADLPVIGFDIDTAKPEALRKGSPTSGTATPERVAKAFSNGTITATTHIGHSSL